MHRHTGFYRHYQIGGGGKPDETASEPKNEGELKTRYVGSHSPFGLVWQIAAATGWTVREILWKINYQTLRMMLADAPHYETERTDKPKTDGRKRRQGKAKSTARFFQSMLNKDQNETS